MRKPPIGLMPERIWKEKRVHEIVEAINRYIQAGNQIPVWWVEEYNKLVSAEKA